MANGVHLEINWVTQKERSSVDNDGLVKLHQPTPKVYITSLNIHFWLLGTRHKMLG